MGRLLKKAAEMEAAAGRKRKVYSGESELSESSIQLKTRRLADVSAGNSALAVSSESLDDGLASCCSSNGSSELALEASKFVDLELDSEATVDSLDCGERRETTPLREAGELESTARPPEKIPRRRSASVKMPSEAELDEFFSAAEKSIQQKFINKYNYDIVKDQPLEGRYEWVEVQPRRQE